MKHRWLVVPTKLYPGHLRQQCDPQIDGSTSCGAGYHSIAKRSSCPIGVIKLFRHYETNKKIEVVTAFRALPELIPSNRNAGLVLDWQQGQGKALVAGDVKVIRVWNAATEVCTNVSIQCLVSQIYHVTHKSSMTGHSGKIGLLHHILDI